MRRLLFLMPILLCAAVSAHAQSLDAFKQRLAEPARRAAALFRGFSPGLRLFGQRACGARRGFCRQGAVRGDLSRREGLRGLRDSLFHRFGGQLPDQGGGHHAQGACVGDLPEGFSQAAEEGEIPDFQPFGPIKVRFRKIILFSLLFPGEYLTLRRYGTINN